MTEALIISLVTRTVAVSTSLLLATLGESTPSVPAFSTSASKES